MGLGQRGRCRRGLWLVAMATFVWKTPAAPAAIAVVAVPPRPALLDRALPAPGTARFARLVDPAGRPVDEVVADRVDADTLHLMTHGGPGVRAAVTAALEAHGLLHAPAPTDPCATLAHPAAVAWRLDHPEAPEPHAWLHRIPTVLITGPANAGKSSLLNAWCGRQRALVSPIPGTTRDLVAATALVGGWRLRLFDSAGLRATDDPLERAGQDLVAQARGWADVVVRLVPPDEETPVTADLVVLGKADLRPPGPGLRWSVHGSTTLLDDLGRAVLNRLGLVPSAG